MIDRANDVKGRFLHRLLLFVIATALVTFAGVVLGGGTLRTLSEIRGEIARRRAANDLLAEGNRTLREEIDALKDDPRVLEKAIRDELSLVEDREVIVVFDPMSGKTPVLASPRASVRTARSR